MYIHDVIVYIHVPVHDMYSTTSTSTCSMQATTIRRRYRQSVSIVHVRECVLCIPIDLSLLVTGTDRI